MAAPAIQVDGLRETRKELRRVDDAVGKEMLRDAHKNLAEKVAALALPHVPVRSGALKATVRGLGSIASARGVAGKATVPYAAAVHWGTGPRPGQKGPHNIARRPFLWDAIEQLRRAGAVDEYARQLEKILDRLTRGR